MINSSLVCSIKGHKYSSSEEFINSINEKVKVSVNRVPLKLLKNWNMTETGALVHETGKFFSIDGININTDYSNISHWEQPIIVQPEIGILGIITKEFDGILHFLMQAKIEPGNINQVQISPTLQATKSNYTAVHKGNKPKYLEYFINVKPHQVLLDQIQSEQGARFLKKRNRNIIIKIDEDIPLFDNFIWMSLGEIKRLMRKDNIVNMDTRTVLSGIDFSKYVTPLVFSKLLNNDGDNYLKSFYSDYAYHSINDLLSWLTDLKSKHDLFVEKYPINKMQEWNINEFDISRYDGKYFKVIGADITIENREVAKWSQPLVKPCSEGICVFVVKKINGILHFLVQAKLECGNLDIFELSPTIQCLTGGYTQGLKNKIPYINLIDNNEIKILFDAYQSEEGGRFYHEQNRNLIIEVPENMIIEESKYHKWMTLKQLLAFMQFNNYLNIQARSLISVISFN